MKRISKKILCLVLAGLFCLTTLVGCAGEGENEEQTSDTTPVSDTVPENTENNVHDLQVYDFKGAEYKILARKSTIYEFDHDNSSGLETVNNAIYLRNETTASTYNAKIRIETVAGDWDSKEFTDKYAAVVQSGWSDYAMISAHFAMVQMMSVNGYCRDLTTLESIDMRKAWWSKQFYDNCNIEGKFYVAVGDIAYTLYEYMQVVFFNETMADSILVDAAGEPIDLYQMVRNKEWTWEKLKEYTKLVTVVDEENGPYGFMTNAHSLRSFATSFELEYATKSTDGEYVRYSFPTSANEKIVTAIDDIVQFVQTTPSVKYNKNNGADEGALNPIFTAGNALFYTQMLGQIPTLAEKMTQGQKYGVLPFPLYNEDQMEYHTALRDSLSAISVPKNVQDLNFAGVMTEALCMYSYDHVRPTYLDTVVKGRYMSDENMKGMLDTIRETVAVDFAMAYNANLSTPYSAISGLCNTSNPQSYASSYAKSAPTYAAKLETIYKALGVSSGN